MTRPDLEAIRARCEAATPGPWKYCAGSGAIEGVNTLIARGAWPNSGPFIAAARTDVLALLDEVERLRIENEHMSRALKDAVDLQKVARQDAFRRGAEAMRTSVMKYLVCQQNEATVMVVDTAIKDVHKLPTPEEL